MGRTFRREKEWGYEAHKNRNRNKNKKKNKGKNKINQVPTNNLNDLPFEDLYFEEDFENGNYRTKR